MMGGFIKKLEDKATSVPLLGDVIQYSRTKGIEEFNKAAYRRALEPIGGKVPEETGRAGMESVKNQISGAYNELLPKLTYKPDNQFLTSLSNVKNQIEGIDPSDPLAWALKGVWQLGYIFNRRCFYKWAGDVLLLTQDGLVPLASALQSSRLDPRINITDKIFYAISQAADVYSTEFGWQVIYYAKPNMLIINVPDTTGTQQYVMHTISKAWCNFTGINTTCFELHNDDIYFGGTGFVGKFFDTNADDGAQISATCQQAYSYFDNPGQQKRFTMVRPTFLVDVGAPGIYCGINTDFQTQNNLGKVTFQPFVSTTGIWDVAKWDEDVFAGNLVISRQWQGVTGLGYSGGINLNMVSAGIDVHWVSTDFVMEKGTVI